MMFTEEKEMSVKQEDNVQAAPSDVPVVTNTLVMTAEDLSDVVSTVTRLMKKRHARNLYMKKYRAHQRLLPTYAVLMRFQCAIKFTSQSGVECNTEIMGSNLHIRLHHDTIFQEDRIYFLADFDRVEAKKIVSKAIIKAYKE